MRAALVTGGSAGIGLAIAEAMSGSYEPVYVTGRSEERMAAARARGLAGIRADMSEATGRAAMTERITTDGSVLDLLVANAGTAELTLLGQTDEAVFDRTFNLNVKSVYFTIQALLPNMADGGSIILIGSIFSQTGTRGFSVYSASKAALRSLARSWANELRDRRIRVNVVSPGPVSTDLTRQLAGGDTLAQRAVEREAAERAPAGRMGLPADIASVVRFLASPDASYVNGVDLSVDGGRSQI